MKEHRTLRGHVSDTPWTIDASSLCALQQKRLAAMMQTIATITVANCYTIFFYPLGVNRPVDATSKRYIL